MWFESVIGRVFDESLTRILISINFPEKYRVVSVVLRFIPFALTKTFSSLQKRIIFTLHQSFKTDVWHAKLFSALFLRLFFISRKAMAMPKTKKTSNLHKPPSVSFRMSYSSSFFSHSITCTCVFVCLKLTRKLFRFTVFNSVRKKRILEMEIPPMTSRLCCFSLISQLRCWDSSVKCLGGWWNVHISPAKRLAQEILLFLRILKASSGFLEENKFSSLFLCRRENTQENFLSERKTT